MTLVTIPSVEREQLRDLVRCREDIRADLMRARGRAHGRGPQCRGTWAAQGCSGGTSSAAASCSRSPSPRRRIQKNFALFDFELGADDIQRIAALDKGETGRTGPNPDTFAYIPG